MGYFVLDYLFFEPDYRELFVYNQFIFVSLIKNFLSKQEAVGY
jgi:hypothetical protein